MKDWYLISTLILTTSLSSVAASAKDPQAAEPNGITVSEPKIYEERSLRLMLDSAEARLSSLGFIDQSRLSVGSIQGGTSKTSITSVEASPLASSEIVDKASSATIKDGTTTNQSRDITQKSFDVEPPNLPDQAAPGTPTGFGLSARDLLAEQLSMTYEVANLRLAMDRAISDRVTEEPCLPEDEPGSRCYASRLPVLIGFQVSLDPPRRYKNAIAEIEITLSQSATPPTLVTLLPSKDAYNVSALTRDTKGLGLGAIAGVFQIGASTRRNKETYYLIRQADTIGLQYQAPAGYTSFGWQFRPVLGRPIVDSGIRPVFALLTIPDLRNGQSNPVALKIVSRWRKWDAKAGIVKEVIDDSKRERTETIAFHNLAGSERHLKPWVTQVNWVESGPNQALVTVKGESFLSDTKIIVGQTTYDSQSGLRFSSEGALSFVTPLNQLSAARTTYLVGRYLDQIRLENPRHETAYAYISKVTPAYIGDGRYRLKIDVGGFRPKTEPVVIIGGTVFVVGGSNPLNISWDERDRPKELYVEASPELLRANSRIIVRELFGGQNALAESTFELPEDFVATKIVTIAKTTTGVVYGIVGSNFDNNTEVLVGDAVFKAPPALVRSNFFTIKPTWEQVRGVEQVVVRKGSQLPVVVLPLKDTPEVKKPQFVGSVTVGKGLSKPVTFKGSDLLNIVKVTFEGEDVVFKVVENGSKLEVEMTTKITTEAGEKALKLTLIDESTLFLPFTVA